MTNKEKVLAVLKSLETGDSKPAENYINKDKYIQHNVNVPDGREALIGFLPILKKDGTKFENIRIFEDGDYVFTHNKYFIFGSEKVAFDIFRFENGLIVEHWDNLSELTQANPSGRTQLDGATKITDLDTTKENKSLISNFINDVLMGKNADKVVDYIGKEYLQHNSNIGDGLNALGIALTEMAKNGMAMVYTKSHMLLAEGNFVLTVCEANIGNKPHAMYDLFRVDNGKIAEHWDIIEEMVPSSQHQHTNGKF